MSDRISNCAVADAGGIDVSPAAGPADERRNPVRCCVACGRDTRHGDGLCANCRPGRGRKDMRDRPLLPLPPEELEDDYSEESDADSVCGDQEDIG